MSLRMLEEMKSFFTALIGKNKDAGTDTLFGYVADKETQAAIYNALGNGSGIIKSIQRGTLNLTQGTSGSATINAVDVNKSIVLYGGSTYKDCDYDGYIYLKNSTTIEAIRTTGGSITSKFPYQVVEFY